MQRFSLPARDWAIIAMLVLFVFVAFTIELYWVVYCERVVDHTGLIVDLLRLYSAADNAYYGPVHAFPLALESFNVFFTQPLNLWLIWAILKRRPYRHALQLALGAYVSYSVILYFWTTHLAGYDRMNGVSAGNLFLFFTPNLPWLVAHLYMAWDSGQAISRRFEAEVEMNAV